MPKLTDGGVVLDTSAILALVQNEAGAANAASLSYGASLSAVNLTEVVSKLNDFSVSMAKFDEIMRDFAIKVITFDEPFAYAAGALRNDTRAYGLSLGDRACLGLFLALGATTVTADRVWALLEIPGLRVELVR